MKRTPQQKIVKFMQAKQKILNKNLQGRIRYFNKADKDAILKWSYKKATEVWDYIFVSIFIDDEEGLGYHTCPFCLYYIGCKKCTYGKNHGICESYAYELDSDFTKINDKFGLTCSCYHSDCGCDKPIYDKEILGNEHYREIIKEIYGK